MSCTQRPVSTVPPLSRSSVHERVDEAGAASFHDRPPAGVRHDGKEDAEGGGERGVERQHGVGADSRQEALCLVGREPPGEMGDRRQSGQAEAGHDDRITRRGPEGCEHRRNDGLGRLDQRPEEAGVLGAVLAEMRRRCRQPCRRPPRQRLRSRGWAKATVGPAKLHADPFEAEVHEKRRQRRHGLHGRADVVVEARQSELLGSTAAARARRPLEDLNVKAAPSTSAAAKPFGPDPTTTTSGVPPAGPHNSSTNDSAATMT